MTKRRILPAIMAGGVGERLWPLSTEAHPKQFRSFASGDGGTLYQNTLARLSGERGQLSFTAPLLLCNARHRAQAEAQARAIGVTPAALALEPIGRNTAAAAVIAAALAQELEPGALVLLAPAD